MATRVITLQEPSGKMLDDIFRKKPTFKEIYPKIDADTIQIVKGIIEIDTNQGIKKKTGEMWIDEEAKLTELLFDTLRYSLDYLQTGEDNIKFSDEPEEEIEKFINSLNNEQLERCFKHVESLPSLYYTQDNSCSKCSKETKIELKGFQDFLE